jgi:formylglycine-generating enzyme required for sulfatase activity
MKIPATALAFILLTSSARTTLASQTAPALSMEFAKISPGEFLMGCAADDSKCDDEEKPAHRVRITRAFELGKYEVTQAQWQAVMGSNPSNYLDPARPVEKVIWTDVQAFLAKMNAKNDGFLYRLPTEAEWETAEPII